MLRKGKTKTILESSIDSALLGVEIFNKPRAPFRVENYITLMIISWTKLFHAYFCLTKGDVYYHKKKNSTRYKIVDGERKTWELSTCIKKYNELEEPVKANLGFFIKLRNKIEHRNITREDIGSEIFGECQSLLYNYENLLVMLFGEEYAINENLAFSLQFSRIRTSEQENVSKKLLSRDIKDINDFITKYRSGLKSGIFNSQDYSVKLFQIPKIVNNASKNIPAIEFVNWSSLSEEDRGNYGHLVALIKNKILKTEVVNPGKLKAGDVVKRVIQNTSQKDFNHHDHKCLYYLFSIRPIKSENLDKFKTNTKYCHYDEVHNDYVFQNSWADFIIMSINEKKILKPIWKKRFKEEDKIDLSQF